MFKKLYLFLTLLTAFLWLGSGTAWGAQSLPYSYGFETALETDGWTLQNPSGSNSSYVGINSSAAKTGSNGYRLSSYSSSAKQYLISPELDATTGVIMQFYYKASSSYSAETFKVGYSTSDNSTSSFTWGSEVSASNSWTQTVEYEFPAGTKYVAIYYYANSDRYHLYVDDITLSAPPTCPKPTALTASAVAATSATFTWTAGGSETSWQYICLPTETALDWSDAGVQTATSATATVSELNDNTNYKFYVRAYCSGSDQSVEVSETFKTLCVGEDASSGWSESFTGLTTGSGKIPDCWGSVTYTYSSTTYPYIYGSDASDGDSRCLAFNGGTTTATVYAILPPFEQAIKDLFISFDYKNGSTSTWYPQQFSVGYVTNPKDMSTYVNVQTFAQSTSFISTDDVNFPNTVPLTATNIVIRYAGNQTYSTSGYVDNIKVGVQSSCVKPTGLTAAAASATSINLSWTKGGDESMWNAQYRIGSGAWTAVNNIPTTVDGTNCTATLTGLTAQTTYEIQVQADCSGSTSSWSNSATETTECNKKSIPWTCGFEESEGYATGSYSSEAPNKCWNILNINGTAPYGYVNNSSSYVRTGSKSLYFVSATDRDGYLIFPELDAALNTLQIEFYHKEEGATQSSTLTLGYMTDVTDASSFVPLKEDPFTRVAGTWSHEEESLAGVPANVASTARLAFKVGKTSNSSWYLGIDDITISELPSCVKPSITASNVIYNGATITWALGSADNKWKLQYKASGDADWTNANSGNLIAASSFNLTGLQSGTTYQVQAQAECEGDWSNAVSFTPQCLKPSTPEVPQATITTTSAVVNWTAGNGEDEWYLQYKKSSESVWSDAIHVTTNPTYTLTGLQSGTTYGVHVAAGCKEDYTASTEFDTECAVVTSFPWTEDFENQTANTSAKCWDISASGTSTKSGDYKYRVWGVYEYNSNKMLRMYNYMVDNGTAIIYSPSITIPNNDKEYELSFDYTNTANCGAFKVKVSKDAGAYFAEVGSYANATSVNEYTNPGTFTPATISLADYAGETIILQFYSLANYSEGAIFVDNIKIDEAPSCADPTGLGVDEESIGTTTATATWTAGGSETAWTLQYKTTAVEWNDESVVEETINTTPSYDFTGLTENTAYTVRVKANCGVGDESEWVELAQPFRTDCANKTVTELVAWTENFESQESGKIPTCWGEVSTYASSAYTQVNAGAAKDGSLGVQVYVYSTHTEIALLPVFETEIKNLKISFDYKNYNTGSNYAALEVGYYNGGAFTNVTTLDKTTSFTASGEIEMPKTAPEGARIAFRVVGKKSGYNGSAYIDNISVIRKPACAVPTITAANATSDGAVVTWTPGDEENQWNLRYRVKDADTWTVLENKTSGFALTGLTVGTTYEVQVQAYCDELHQSAWSASAEFEPVCNAPSALAVTARAQNSATFSWTSSETAWVLQYSTDGENWESENVATNPFTLTGLAAGQTYQAKIQAACGSDFSNVVEFTTWCDAKDAAELPLNIESFTAVPDCWQINFVGEYSGITNNKIYFYGAAEQMAVLPAYDIELNKLSVTFGFSTNSANLEFGYLDEPNGTFHAFASQPATGVELNLENEATAVKYIAIRYTGTNTYASGSISSVQLRKTPNCLKPTDVAGTPGVGSASISWTENGSAEAWNLQYKTGSADWTTLAVTTNPYALNGLEQGLTYKVRVQAACAGEDPSDWSDEASFTTDCDAVSALPFIETFDAALSNCWDITDDNTSTYAHSVYGSELRLPGGKAASGHLVKLPNITASFTNAVMTIEYKATTGANTAVPQMGYIDGEGAFQEITTLDKSNTTTEVRVALASYTGKRLAFRYDDGTSEGNFDIAEIRILDQVTLADNTDISATLAAYNGKAADITVGRTIVRKGYFNTICLPFSLSAEELAASPIASDSLWAFKYAKVEGDELLFRIVEADHIEAGVPYFIYYEDNAEDIVSPLFKNVTISATAGQEVGNDVAKLCGIVDQPVVFNAGDQTKLFLAANNTLYWWSGSAASQLNNFRAYFKVATGGGANNAPRHGMKARIIRQEEVATGVENVQLDAQTLKLIENGNVVIIRNGVKYNIQGQVISK